jgi:hypothetical protein
VGVKTDAGRSARETGTRRVTEKRRSKRQPLSRKASLLAAHDRSGAAGLARKSLLIGTNVVFKNACLITSKKRLAQCTARERPRELRASMQRNQGSFPIASGVREPSRDTTFPSQNLLWSSQPHGRGRARWTIRPKSIDRSRKPGEHQAQYRYDEGPELPEGRLREPPLGSHPIPDDEQGNACKFNHFSDFSHFEFPFSSRSGASEPRELRSSNSKRYRHGPSSLTRCVETPAETT